jgi:hypothetical protein
MKARIRKGWQALVSLVCFIILACFVMYHFFVTGNIVMTLITTGLGK